MSLRLFSGPKHHEEGDRGMRGQRILISSPLENVNVSNGSRFVPIQLNPPRVALLGDNRDKVGDDQQDTEDDDGDTDDERTTMSSALQVTKRGGEEREQKYFRKLLTSWSSTSWSNSHCSLHKLSSVVVVIPGT